MFDSLLFAIHSNGVSRTVLSTVFFNQEIPFDREDIVTLTHRTRFPSLPFVSMGNAVYTRNRCSYKIVIAAKAFFFAVRFWMVLYVEWFGYKVVKCVHDQRTVDELLHHIYTEDKEMILDVEMVKMGGSK